MDNWESLKFVGTDRTRSVHEGEFLAVEDSDFSARDAIEEIREKRKID